MNPQPTPSAPLHELGSVEMTQNLYRHKSIDSLETTTIIHWTFFEILRDATHEGPAVGDINKYSLHRYKSFDSLETSTNIHITATKVSTAWDSLETTTPPQKLRQLRDVIPLGHGAPIQCFI